MFDGAPPVKDMDVLTSPDAVAAELATSPPRAEDMAVLLMIDPDTFSDAGRVDLLVAFERPIALLQAAQQQVLASLDGRAWIGPVRRSSITPASRSVPRCACRLAPPNGGCPSHGPWSTDWPATLDLLRCGQITYPYAMMLAEAVITFDDETTAKIERRVLTRAAEQTLSQFGTSLRRAVIAADPRRAAQRHDETVAQRRVMFTPQDDGVTELWALLPADGAALIEAVLNSLATGQTHDRSADQRRADALVDVFARVLGDPSLPEQHGQRPAIQVTASLGTLLGCDNQPAELDGYGPITSAVARRLATDSSGAWRRLVTDDTGQTPRLRPPHVPSTGQPHGPRHRP